MFYVRIKNKYGQTRIWPCCRIFPGNLAGPVKRFLTNQWVTRVMPPPENYAYPIAGAKFFIGSLSNRNHAAGVEIDCGFQASPAWDAYFRRCTAQATKYGTDGCANYTTLASAYRAVGHPPTTAPQAVPTLLLVPSMLTSCTELTMPICTS